MVFSLKNKLHVLPEPGPSVMSLVSPPWLGGPTAQGHTRGLFLPMPLSNADRWTGRGVTPTRSPVGVRFDSQVTSKSGVCGFGSFESAELHLRAQDMVPGASRGFAVAGGEFWGRLVKGCSIPAPCWFSIAWREARC